MIRRERTIFLRGGGLASSTGNSYIKARVRDWYGGQKDDWVGWGPLFARLGPSARSFAPFLPQTPETQELPAEEARGGCTQANLALYWPISLVCILLKNSIFDCRLNCNNSYWPAPEQRTGIAEGMGSNPVSSVVSFASVSKRVLVHCHANHSFSFEWFHVVSHQDSFRNRRGNGCCLHTANIMSSFSFHDYFTQEPLEIRRGPLQSFKSALCNPETLAWLSQAGPQK